MTFEPRGSVALWTARRVTVYNAPLRVLVVDDNRNGAEALAAYLTFERMDCRVAFGGHEAIAVATAWIPQPVIMDISMPDCTGFEAALALRQDPRTHEIAIIAFTALVGHANALSVLARLYLAPRRLLNLNFGSHGATLPVPLTKLRSSDMNKNTIDGTLKQVKGSLKEALGKVTGNTSLEVEGAAEKTEGKVQEGVGKTQEKAKDIGDKLTGKD